MSSLDIDRYVSILNGGGNYATWALNMEAFLMTQTLNHVLTDAAPVTVGQTPTTDELKAITDFKANDERARGFILLRVSAAIGYRVRKKGHAKAIWDYLKNKYGQSGITAVYSEFKKALSLPIPIDINPIDMLDEFQVHFHRLADEDCKFPNYLSAMILLAKLPPSMQHIAQSFTNIANVKDLDLADVCRSIVFHWELHAGHKAVKDGMASKLGTCKYDHQKPCFQGRLHGNGGTMDGKSKPKFRARGQRGGNRGRGQRNTDNAPVQPDTSQGEIAIFHRPQH